jgi:hypothetical protein
MASPSVANDQLIEGCRLGESMLTGYRRLATNDMGGGVMKTGKFAGPFVSSSAENEHQNGSQTSPELLNCHYATRKCHSGYKLRSVAQSHFLVAVGGL